MNARHRQRQNTAETAVATLCLVVAAAVQAAKRLGGSAASTPPCRHEHGLRGALYSWSEEAPTLMALGGYEQMSLSPHSVTARRAVVRFGSSGRVAVSIAVSTYTGKTR